MVNFMRRFFAFFAGVIFTFVLIVGGIVGGGYYAFKNLTPKDVGMSEETFGGLASMTFEEWTAFIMEVKNDPQSLTIKELEKQGFDTDAFLTSMGVDVANANPKDIEGFRELAVGALFGDSALYEVNMGILFLFIPKDAETGKYPVFSEGARNRLRQYSLGDVFGGEPTDNSGFSSILRSMKLGSVLSSVYDEQLEDGEFVYKSEDMGLDLLANVEMGLLTDGGEGGLDLGYEIKEGYLTSLEDKELVEIIASFGATSEEDFNQKYDSLSLLAGVGLGELFTFDTEENKYKFTFDPVLQSLSLGKLFGVQLCSNDESCKVRHESGVHDGKLYEISGSSEEFDKLVEGDNLQNTLYANLCSITIVDLMGSDLDISVFLDGMVLGSAFGYVKCTGASDCPIHADNGCGSFANKWFTEEDVYVGNMLNDLAGTELNELLNGEGFDINGMLYESKIGELFGYVQCAGEGSTESCPIHANPEDCVSNDNAWYEWKDDEYKLIEATDVAQKVMLQLYNKTLETMGEITIDSLMGDITLGEFLNLTYDEENDVWLDVNEEEVSIIYSSIAGLTITDLRQPDAITDSIGGIVLGEFMGYEKRTDGEWYDKNGDKASAIYSAIADVTITELMENPTALTSELESLQIGELMRYEKRADGEWYNDDEIVTGVEKTLADVLLGDVLNGTLIIEDEISGIQIGVILGYEYDGTKWVDDAGTPAPNEQAIDKILYQLYDKTLSDLSGGGIVMEDLIDGIPLGELLGYTKNGEFWYDGTQKIDDSSVDGKIFYSIYNKTVTEFTSLEIADLMGNITLGEFMGYKLIEGAWYEKKADNSLVPVSVLYSKIAGIKITELMDDPTVLEDSISNLYVGSFIEGYVQVGGVWKDALGNELKGVDKIVAEISLGKVLSGDLDIKQKIDNLPVGEVMGFTKNGEFWYNGSVKVENSDLNGKVLYGIYDKPVGELSTLDITEILDGVYLGEFLGLEKDGSVWYEKGSDPRKQASVLYATIADISVPELLENGNLITEKLEVLHGGDFMGYTYTEDAGGNRTWYNGGVEVTGIDKIAADILLGDVLSGNLNLDSKVQDLKLSDIIEINDSSSGVLKYLASAKVSELSTKVGDMELGDVIEITPDSNNILKLLANTKLTGDSLSTKINSLLAGDVMGFTKCTGELGCPVHENDGCAETKGLWYEQDADDNWVLETGVEARVADLTINDLSHHGIKGINFVLGDVLTDKQIESGLFELADKRIWKSDANNNPMFDKIKGTDNYVYEVERETDGDLVYNADGTVKYNKTEVLAPATGEIEGRKHLYEELRDEGGNIVKVDGKSVYKEYEDVAHIPVMELADRVSYGAETASYAQLEHAGLLHLSVETTSKLDSIFDIIHGEGVWETWTVDKIFNEIVNSIPSGV